MSDVISPPAETDNLLNLGEGDSPSAPPPSPPPPIDHNNPNTAMAMPMPPVPVEQALEEEEVAYQKQQQQQQQQQQTPGHVHPPPPTHGVHEQAFVHQVQHPYTENNNNNNHSLPQPDEDHHHHHHHRDDDDDEEDDDDDGDDGQDDDDETVDSSKRANSTDGGDDDGPLKKKKKLLDGSSSNGKRKGRKPGSLNKRRNSYNLDRGGPMPSWNDMFFALMAFRAKLGTFNVPAQTKLGKWVTKQRQEYSKIQRKKIDYNQCSELSEERIQVLDSLGFIWDTMLHENGRRWHQRFEELKQWKEEHGHCNVPQSTSLGQWVKIQRENKREADLKTAGKLPSRTKPKPCLAPDRIEKLNSIGFQWRVAAPVTGWDNRYNQLLEYAKAHNGDVNVPQYYPADKAFGRWVMKQRSEYSLRLRGLKSQLTDERVEKLNAIGFSWVAPNFKRKVGVGIAPGSPAANIAAASMQEPETSPTIPKLPPMEKAMLGDSPSTLVPQPVPTAAETTAPTPAPPQPQHDPHNPAQPPMPPPTMVHHHAHHEPAPVPMEAPGDYHHPLHHDPHQQHLHSHHLPPAHHIPTPDPDAMHHHHHHPHQPPMEHAHPPLEHLPQPHEQQPLEHPTQPHEHHPLPHEHHQQHQSHEHQQLEQAGLLQQPLDHQQQPHEHQQQQPQDHHQPPHEHQQQQPHENLGEDGMSMEFL